MDLDIRILAPTATSIGIIVSIFLWILNQRKKELSYEILFLDQLVKVTGNARKHLDVTFNGRRVDDARLAIVRVFNSGHLPITKADFVMPISVDFSPGSRVMLVDIAETQPADLDDRCKVGDNTVNLIDRIDRDKVILHPVLLNEGDSITMQILVHSEIGRPTVKGHIMGVRHIREHKPYNLAARSFTHIGALIMTGAMLMVEPKAIVSYNFEEVLPYVLLFVLGYILFWMGLNWPKPVVSYLGEAL